MSGLIVLFWFVAGGVALRYFVRQSISCHLHQLLTDRASQVLFIGVMSCLYVLWDVVGASCFYVSFPLRSLLNFPLLLSPL